MLNSFHALDATSGPTSAWWCWHWRPVYAKTRKPQGTRCVSLHIIIHTAWVHLDSHSLCHVKWINVWSRGPITRNQSFWRLIHLWLSERASIKTSSTLTHTLGAGHAPHGSLCAVSHREISPACPTAAYTSFSLQLSWYQHTEAAGQRLPDTDAVGVPWSQWLSGTAVISHDISATLRMRASWAAGPVSLNLHILAASFISSRCQWLGEVSLLFGMSIEWLLYTLLFSWMYLNTNIPSILSVMTPNVTYAWVSANNNTRQSQNKNTLSLTTLVLLQVVVDHPGAQGHSTFPAQQIVTGSLWSEDFYLPSASSTFFRCNRETATDWRMTCVEGRGNTCKVGLVIEPLHEMKRSETRVTVIKITTHLHRQWLYHHQEVKGELDLKVKH